MNPGAERLAFAAPFLAFPVPPRVAGGVDPVAEGCMTLTSQFVARAHRSTARAA